MVTGTGKSSYSVSIGVLAHLKGYLTYLKVDTPIIR